MSTHRVDVVRIKDIERHPNADALDLVKVFGYTCCIRRGELAEGDLAVYVEPDYVVDSTRPEFAFLAGHERIKVRKLRGIYSQGLLIKAPPGMSEGQDVMEHYGIRRYEPPMPLSTGGESERPPAGFFPSYDVESWRRFGDTLVEGEEVVVTEKIHGASARFAFRDDRMRAGSRTEWKVEDPRNLWWQALERNPWIEPFCRAHPDMAVYGEAFGRVQDLRYGAGKNDIFFRAFDVLSLDRWLDFDELAAILPDDRRVPVVFRGPYARALESLAEGPTMISGADHVREGIVIRPVKERTDPELGRVQLKIVSNAYLERA
ncbi:MAG: RNA ligase (ATP) [Acidobacteriota bacterium]